MSSPYRESGAASDWHTKYPRIVIADDRWRLVQLADDRFALEQATTDSMGVRTWTVKSEARGPSPDVPVAMGVHTIAGTWMEFWLCQKIVQVTS